jgi:hypothetical protein
MNIASISSALLFVAAPAPDAGAKTEAAPAPSPEVKADAEPKETPHWERVRFYGRLRAAVVGTGGGSESYTQQNHSAITAAANPLFRNPDADPATSFQIGQSRFGLKVNEKGKASGTIELDFVDFTKATGAVALRPRLRIGTVDWKPAEDHKLTFGLTWDLYGALQTYTHNWVGNHFYSGNTAFMRHQFQYIWNPKRVEVGFAVGLPGLHNNAADVGALEANIMPTLAGRAALKFGNKSRIGVSGIYTSLDYGSTRRDTASGLAFLDLNVKDVLNLRGEAYAGQNLGNIGALSLSYGREDQNMYEAGGWGSAKLQFPKHVVAFTAGAAAVINANDAAAGYTRDEDTGAVSRTGVGITRNTQLRLGYEYRPVKGLGLYVEPFAYFTTHQLLPEDRAVVNADRQLAGAELGAVYHF